MEKDCCSICLENFNDNNQYYNLDCNHTFHTKCIIDWFRTNDQKSCPICRNKPKNKFKTEKLIELLHENSHIPEVADLLQHEDELREGNFQNFYLKVCNIINNFIPLSVKVKFLLILFIISIGTSITIPFILSSIAIKEIYNKIYLNI